MLTPSLKNIVLNVQRTIEIKHKKEEMSMRIPLVRINPVVVVVEL